MRDCFIGAMFAGMFMLVGAMLLLVFIVISPSVSFVIQDETIPEAQEDTVTLDKSEDLTIEGVERFSKLVIICDEAGCQVYKEDL